MDKLSNLKDDEIITLIIDENSSKYFGILYKRYYSKVLDKCYSFVKNKQLAEEITEDIFSKVYEKLASFKNRSSFSSWLYSITYNHCIDYLREKKKLHYPSWDKENEIPEIIDDTDEIIEDINYENLLVVLKLIHPEEEALLLMKYKDDLSMKQIATALRISEDAAKMRLKRARARVLFLYTQKFLL
ncbi:RNA polymerase sigma factor [Carboxylicivirga caseinilyticus]|uniref:RNA polymerase sigma factor n=1 Tax=Carboxylicivirga caseinilyticus TaxID=3417572 RepID=UPI002AA8E79F|nr:RNA polymerase sigma factor [uncultured Carboxylicivirga sp.]MCU4164378.1 RNA polymerase sigma factor [Marinilabiliaceae bacterium A049]